MTLPRRRILTIDGGGLKGMIPAAFLANVEAQLGQPLHQYFDLIVGTSTGGIIAAGIALGMPAEHIASIYRDHGPRIFPTLTWRSRARLWFAGLTRAKYPTATLRKVLNEQFADLRIGESKTRLVIPSWDRTAQREHVWKTRHCGRFRNDFAKPIVEALVSTASAPTYFSSAPGHGGTGLVDGGVWANNPMLVATVEALGVLKWNPASVQMLSLGCVREDDIPPESGGLLRWALPGVNLLMQAQSRFAIGGAYLLLGDRPNSPRRILRIEASAPKGHFSLDGASGLPEMERLGGSLGRNHLDQLRPIFFDVPTIAFRPLPADAKDEEVS